MKTQSLSELYRTDPLKACRQALRDTKSIHWTERMEAINELLGTDGVEAMRGAWQNGYWCHIVATYCNAGDTYEMTVICVRGEWQGRGPRFMVTSLGDFVERYGRRYGIE